MPDAKVIAGGKELISDYDGKVEYKNQLLDYIRVSASGYQTKKVDLRPYAQGSVVSVTLSKLADVTKPPQVYVKDKNGKPIEGASITVYPGVSAVTNGSGYAKAAHKQQQGEYIEVAVSAKGFKDQQQRVVVGNNRQVSGGSGSIRAPDDMVSFVMEKGDNDRNVINLVVEVVDDENYIPVNGASVKVQLSDGSSFSGNTNNKGEAKFTDMEYGFQGTTARVMVTHKDYKEKWSDITSDLMTAKDMDVRRFSVAVSKKEPAEELKEKSGLDVSGRWDWVCCDKKYSGSFYISQAKNKISGPFGWGEIDGEIKGQSVTFKRKGLVDEQDYNLVLSADGKTLTGSFTGIRNTSVGTDFTAKRR